MNINRRRIKIIGLVLCSLFTADMACADVDKKPYELVNSNLGGATLEKFFAKNLVAQEDIDSLPIQLRAQAVLSNKYKFIYISAPTQKTGGFQFEVRVKNSLEFIVCLKAPSPMAPVTMGMNTPVALVKIPKNAHIVGQIKECPDLKD